MIRCMEISWMALVGKVMFGKGQIYYENRTQLKTHSGSVAAARAYWFLFTPDFCAYIYIVIYL